MPTGADSSRSVTEAGVTFYYFYDATDAVVTKNTTNVAPSTATSCADRGFCYDAMGDLTTSSPSVPDVSAMVPTTYTYDPAGHLLSINSGLAGAVSFLLDALGRHWSQTSAGTTTTYAYLGTSDTVSSMSVGANVTTTSLIDAIGDRLGQGTGSAFGAWLIADLHGNIVAEVSPGSSPALLSAYRYDAYGETCGSWSAGSGSIAVPWRFQGRLLESATGGTDLYDFGARSYDPSLGAFTSFDSVAGSAQNPLTLNRYLYANANPATLVDPDGHVVWQGTCRYDPEDCVDIAKAKAHAKAKASALSGTTDMTTAVNNFRSWSANTDMTSAVDKFRSDTGAGACAWDQTADECKNIAAENKKQHYWELCNGGDKSACDTMNRIQVDTGNTSASLHIMLGAATFVPIIGSAAAAADTGLYLYEGDYTDAALSSLAVIPGGKLASGVKALHAGDDAAAAARGFGGLTKAGDFGVWGYSTLTKDIAGTGLEAHHLIEQRFTDILNVAGSKMASIAVTPGEHQVFTNLWRRLIPYGAGTASATPTSIMDAAREIYQDFPAILSALGL